ncbi:BT4734/BF3469 family protein [Lacihabitans lacunae]|uniref:BT4734/BF3469 family protein n=1 Tax=Lacihabitans lacunae TaxID=1028214 RepID=A0ABV7YU97_9BACT
MGQNITQHPVEALSCSTIEDLVALIKNDNQVLEKIARLRKLRALDIKAYKSLKTQLPYFVGSKFKNDIRNSENFESANYLILDIDDYFGENAKIPQNICEHPEVLMAFISPSGTGFKIVFKLESECKNLKDFKEFYKNYARKFADQVKLEGAIDFKTCDATRACFISSDNEVAYNPSSLTVNWTNYIEKIEEIDFQEKTNEINEQAYQNVLSKINPTAPKKKDKNIHVPDQLLEMQGDIRSLCLLNGLQLLGLVPINYGLKVQVKKGYSTAEINVFYGKKGFTLVMSPKTGSDPNLAIMLYTILNDLLFKETEKVPVYETKYQISVN